MKAVILAGGLGTRMGDICKEIPKPMTLINKKPVLEYQIEALKKEGITDFILVVGYLSKVIEDYFGNGSSRGVSISYFKEKEPLGTAGALLQMDLNEDFLLCNGDLIFDLDLSSMIKFHNKNNALATLFTHPNNHPYDSTLIETDCDNRVTAFISKNNRSGDFQNLCNAGIQLVSPFLLKQCNKKGRADFDKDIIAPSIEGGRIFSYKSAEYVFDMGTAERLTKVEEDISKGVVSAKHLSKPHKAIFLDRDGTVNIHKGFINNKDEIELVPGAARAIKSFNEKGYLTIIVTNQPVIARGECTQEALRDIHNRLETLLGNEGAYIDGLYYCPHHPDKGFEGEIKELKISCSCRKPQAGMLLKAKEDFNIAMSESFMVGDSMSDVLAGINAGCTPVYISTGTTNEDKLLQFSSLYEFSDYLRRLK